MSNPTRRVRQPGRTAQGHNKPDCGVCNNGAPGPIGLVVNGLNTSGSCCIEPFDNGGAAMSLSAGSGNCSRSNSAAGPYYCSYTYDMSFISTSFRWTVTIECVSDGAGGYHVHVGVSLDEILTGGALHNIAYGDWYSSSFASCGNFDCTFLGNAVGGTLTVTDSGGSWCTPGNCGSPPWGLNTGNVNPCPQPAALNCCCGGTPAPPNMCFYTCVMDSACDVPMVDIQACRTSGTNWSGTDPLTGVKTTITYSPSTGFTISYTCPNGHGNSFTFGTWGKTGGSILLFHDAGDWSIKAGLSPQCVGTGAVCGDCKDNAMAREYLVYVTGTWAPSGTGTNCLNGSQTYDCMGRKCAGSNATNGIPSAYFMGVATSYNGYCAMEGVMPPTGCCDNPQNDCGRCFLFFGHDGGGYFAAFQMLGGLLSSGICEMSPACNYGLFKKYYSSPVDCLNLSGDVMTLVSDPLTADCGCVPVGGCTATVYAID